MTILKDILNTLLISQLAFGSSALLAATSKKPVEPAKLRAAVFTMIARQSAMVNTAGDFEKSFLMSMKKTDRDAIMAQLRNQKRFPTMVKRGDTLTITSDTKTYELQWLDITKYEFIINGVKWAYTPTKPFLPQYEELQNKLRTAKQARFFLIDQVLPEAEALAWLVPVLLMIVGTVIGVVGTDSIKEGWCNGVVEPLSMTTQTCADLKRAKEQALFADMPAMDAVSNQNGADNKNVLSTFEAKEYVCPSNDDGKEREYLAHIRAVETKDGKTTPVSDWFSLAGKFSPDGTPTDLLVTMDGSPREAAKNSDSDSKHLVVHVTFDPTTKKAISFRIPNPDYDPKKDLLGKSTIELRPNMTLTPQQKEMMDKAKDLVKFVNFRNYRCVATAAEENQAAGIETKSPAETSN